MLALSIFGASPDATSAVQAGLVAPCPGAGPQRTTLGDDVVDITVAALIGDLRTSPPPFRSWLAMVWTQRYVLQRCSMRDAAKRTPQSASLRSRLVHQDAALRKESRDTFAIVANTNQSKKGSQ
jgi:hypothetical protein